MKLYNTLTRKKEEFIPINEGKVSMYVCGPTVYNYVHIGNMRPVLTFDMVYNYFKYLGYDVKYASNFTDINEKISIAAKELSLTEREVADKFIKSQEKIKESSGIYPKIFRAPGCSKTKDIYDAIPLPQIGGYAAIRDFCLGS